MKRIIMFVLLFAALKVAGQTTGYLRFDTVKIMKQNGTCELYIINKTKDSLGLLTNVGGGLTRFIKPKVLNDSTLIIGLDTLVIPGATGSGSTGPPSLTYKYVAYGGVGGVLSPGEAAYTYDSITNKLSVDSADLIQARADSFFIRDQSQYLKPDSVYSGINSHANAQGATTQDSGYAYREAAGLDAVLVNIAVSGTGATSGANRFLINKNPGNTTAAIFMNGFNEPRRNGLPRNTLNKIINSHKAIFANQYLKSYTNAGTGGTGVTRSGSWVSSWDASAEGGKTTVGAYTNTTNDSIRYAFTDSTVIIGLMPGDGSSASYIGTDVDLRIDELPVSMTINTNNQTDGVADGSGLDNKRCAMAVIITGLTNAAHTVTLIKKSTGGGGYLICDYFGHLVDRSQAQLMLWHHIPKMTAAGYATAPANATDATTDTVNAKIDSLKTTYPISLYPTYVVPTNTVYDPDIDADPDGIHMANSGHRKIADLALNSTLNDAVPAPGVNGAIYFDNEFKGVVNGLKETFLMRRAADSRYIRNQNSVTQTADYNISGTGTAQKFVTAGTVFGDNLTVADRQTNGIIAGTAAGNVFFEMRSNSQGADEKSYGFFLGSKAMMWRLLSDNVGTETRFFEVVRNGMLADTIRMPKLDITSGPLKVYAHTIASNSDSAVVWNRTNNAYEIAKVNGGADGNGIYGGNGSLPSDVTVTGANNTLTFNDIFAFHVNSDYSAKAKANGTGIYSEAIVGAGNIYEIGYTPAAGVFSKGAGVFIDTNNNVGMGTNPPTAMPLYATGASTFIQGLQSNHGNFYKVSNITTDGSASLAAYFYTIDATAGNVTVTLPAASTAFGNTMGITYKFQRIDASGNTVTIQRAGSDTINGGASFTLTTQWGVKMIQCTSTSTWAQY